MAAFTQVQIARICTVPGLPGLDRAARAERRIVRHEQWDAPHEG